jgi:hypothetical protein
MPWFLWSLHRCREKSCRYLALAAIFLGLSLLGATLQHAAFIVIALACVWMGWMFEGQSGTKVKGLELQAASGQRSRGWDTLLVVAAGLLGAGLVAFMLEPSITGYLENVRSGHEREGLGYASGLSQPFRMAMVWPLKLYPFVLGSVQTLDLTKAFLPSGVAYVFFGTIPMLLAIIGLFSRRVPLAAKLLIVAGSIIPLTPLVGVLYQRVGLLWILGGCWASSVWLSAAHDESLRRVSIWCWRMLAGVLVLWTLASIALVFFREPLETLLIARAQATAASSQFAMFPDWVGTRAAKLLDYLCVWNPWQLAALAGLLFSLWGMTRCKGESLWPGAVLSVGVALQLSVYWWQWTTWSVERGVYEQPELVRILQQEVGTGGRLAQGSGGPGEIHLPANTLAPAGVAITAGYDSIHPDGMLSATGYPCDFPGTTHFLGRLGEEQPVDWQEVWSDGRWILLRNPEPTVGLVTLGSGLTVPLRPNDLLRGSLNTMEVTVPTGAVKLEVFSNWNRGWKWRAGDSAVWTDTVAGSSGGVLVELAGTPNSATVAQLRFDPTPVGWVLFVTALSGACLVAIVLLPFRLRCCGNERGARRSLKVAQGGE